MPRYSVGSDAQRNRESELNPLLASPRLDPPSCGDITACANVRSFGRRGNRTRTGRCSCRRQAQARRFPSSSRWSNRCVVATWQTAVPPGRSRALQSIPCYPHVWITLCVTPPSLDHQGAGMPDSLWDRLLATLEGSGAGAALGPWLRTCRLVDVDSDHLRLAAPNKYTRDWLAQNHTEALEAAARDLLGGNPRVSIDIEREAGLSPPAHRAARDTPAIAPPTGLSTRYTFDTFVVGRPTTPCSSTGAPASARPTSCTRSATRSPASTRPSACSICPPSASPTS